MVPKTNALSIRPQGQCIIQTVSLQYNPTRKHAASSLTCSVPPIATRRPHRAQQLTHAPRRRRTCTDLRTRARTTRRQWRPNRKAISPPCPPSPPTYPPTLAQNKSSRCDRHPAGRVAQLRPECHYLTYHCVSVCACVCVLDAHQLPRPHLAGFLDNACTH